MPPAAADIGYRHPRHLCITAGEPNGKRLAAAVLHFC